MVLSAGMALLVVSCGDSGDGDEAITSRTAPVDLALDGPVLVTNAEGVFQVGTDGNVSRLFAGTVTVAVDDTQGGLLYQVDSGRSGRPGDRSTVVWWIPRGTSAPQELLVPAPSSGHRLTLHDSYPTAGGFAVLYTRHESKHPVDDFVDSLRRFDVPERRVTELYSQGAFEQGYGEVSVGGELISGTWFDQVGSGCFILDLDGNSTDLAPRAASDPTREDTVDGCRLSPDGTRLAFVSYDSTGATVHVWRLDEGEEAQFVVPNDTGRVGIVDLSDRWLIVNVERDGLQPAVVFDLDAPDAPSRGLPVAGVARLAAAPISIGADVVAPGSDRLTTTETTVDESASTEDGRSSTTPTLPPFTGTWADTTTTLEITTTAPQIGSSGPAPWTASPLELSALPEVYRLEWAEAGEPSTCPLLAYADLGPEGQEAAIRRAENDRELLIAWDNPDGPGHDRRGEPCSDCGRGVIGLGTVQSSSYVVGPATIAWDDGSFAHVAPGHYGIEARIQLAGADCVYRLWSHLGFDHLNYLIGQLRTVDT